MNTVHSGWLQNTSNSRKSGLKQGTCCTVIVRRHATVLRVGRRTERLSERELRELMRAPGNNRAGAA